MRRFLMFFTMAALTIMAGCEKEELCRNEFYTLINQTESDIVVEFGYGETQTTTIAAGRTQLFYRYVYCLPLGVEEIRMPEVLRAEMIIGGEAVPKAIWLPGYWNIDSDQSGNNIYTTYTLIVTDELLETVGRL